MKKCKYCQSEIDSQAKICPNCGKKQGKVKKVAIIIIIIIILLSLFSGGESDEPKSNGNVDNKVETDNINEKVFSLGEEVEYKNMKLIVNSVNFVANYQYNTPDEGNEFVEVNVTIENNSNSEKNYNVYDFSMVTSQGNKIDADSETYGIDGGLSSGDLIAGGKVTGTIVYEVPQNDSSLILYYSPNGWSEKYVKVDCTKK